MLGLSVPKESWLPPEVTCAGPEEQGDDLGVTEGTGVVQGDEAAWGGGGG